ncbi:Tex-like N-terminal domain-containing protein [Bacillus sp. SL00103]
MKQIATELKLSTKQIESVIKLLEDGNTVPFIARYRKRADRLTR